MKSFIVAFFIVNAVAAEHFCSPGSVFNQDCNACVCSPDGSVAACTDIYCPKEMINRKDQGYCEPGKKFKLDDCSTCICNKDGTTAQCTLGLCAFTRNRKAARNDRYCTPGTTFSPDNCNVCTCNRDGTEAFCTMKLCPGNYPQNLNKPKTVCQPNTKFNDYCNICSCSEDGNSYSCTKMWCDKDLWNKDGSLKIKTKTAESGSKQVCQPLMSFKDFCNTCFCSEDGMTYACTRMYCDRDIWNQDGTMKVDTKVQKSEKSVSRNVCEPRTTFKNYCNTCFCADDGLTYACTRMRCDEDLWNQNGTQKVIVDSLKRVERVCEPNSVFKDYCNTCSCSEDGLNALCTMMMCDKDLWNKDGTLKTPEVNEEETLEKVCEPNSVFKDYCNTCSCSEDGLNVLCTMMMCDKDLWNKDGTLKIPVVDNKVEEKSSDKICTPNQQFMESCNSCQCSGDGLSKFCTMMSCEGFHNEESGKIVTDKICEPGNIYSPDGCNTCICNKFGTGSACTLNLCPSPLEKSMKIEEQKNWGPEYHQGDACTPGKLFYSECNQCVCTDSGTNAFCTFMDCRWQA